MGRPAPESRARNQEDRMLKVGHIVRFVHSGNRATVVGVRTPPIGSASTENLIDLVSEHECGIWSELESALFDIVVVAELRDYRR